MFSANIDGTEVDDPDAIVTARIGAVQIGIPWGVQNYFDNKNGI